MGCNVCAINVSVCWRRFCYSSIQCVVPECIIAPEIFLNGRLKFHFKCHYHSFAAVRRVCPSFTVATKQAYFITIHPLISNKESEVRLSVRDPPGCSHLTVHVTFNLNQKTHVRLIKRVAKTAFSFSFIDEASCGCMPLGLSISDYVSFQPT